MSKIVRQIETYVPNGHLLEIGCGRGDFLKLAQTRGFSVTGCDIFGGHKPAFDGISFFDGTLKEAGFVAESFDVVVIRNVLEHLFDSNSEISEIRRVLKPNGALTVKVSSPGTVFYRQKRIGRGGRLFWLYKFSAQWRRGGRSAGHGRRRPEDYLGRARAAPLEA